MNLHILSINSRLYSTRRLVEEAQISGHQVQVFSYQNLPALTSSAFFPDVLIPRIAANMTHEGKLAIQAYEASNCPSVLSSTTLSSVRDKFQCLEQLRLAGLPTPHSQLVDAATVLEPLFIEAFQFPVLLKLTESTHGHGVLLIHSMQELKRMMQLFEKFQPFILQEFVREAAGTDIRAFVVGKRVVASMKRVAQSGDFRSNLHRGGKAKLLALGEQEQLMVLQATRTLGIAVAGVDMLMSSKGLLIIEVNASPGLEGIEKISKKNIAQAIIRYADNLCS